MADKKHEDFRKVLVTPAGVAQYPALLTPDTRFATDGIGTFKCNLVLPEAEAEDFIEVCEGLLAEKLEALEGELTKKQFNAVKEKGLSMPFAIETDDEDDPTGNVVIKAKQKAGYISKKDNKLVERSMQVVDAKKKKISVNVGGGSRVKMAVELSTWHNAANGYGVTARLNAVQVLELMEFGGQAVNMFDEEDGFEADDETDAFTATPTEAPEPSTASAEDV